MSLNSLCKKTILALSLCLFGVANAQNDGSQLWFTQHKINECNLAKQPNGLFVNGKGSTLEMAKNEMVSGIRNLFQTDLKIIKKSQSGCWILSLSNNPELTQILTPSEKERIGNDGFIVRYWAEKESLLITGNTQVSVLYGVFHMLRLMQTECVNIEQLDIVENPAYQYRILNHWDNLDGSVERGYAGRSIWKWDELPKTISPRYKEYTRANASIGINGTVLNNVNANPQILTSDYIKKVKVIAEELRDYGIRVYLSVNFASPKVLGGLSDASPKNEEVIEWWEKKVKEIYKVIPDFGGFLVKANSEGQPGPMDFGCTHADGANMLADALAPYGGIVMWRAFVYSPTGNDRAKQAYNEFMPLDGQFRDNVMVQVKNGPVDFQPREPFSPMFGAMKETQLMPELQITQEYLGFSDHLVYLGTLYQEFLQSDTYTQGKGSTVAKVTDGEIYKHPISGIAGVANIGEDINWCGHHFAQANWYVFGRLAWNPEANIRAVAKDWAIQTLTQNVDVAKSIADMMMLSREATVNYMTPLGLHHLMGWDHHYGPEPWCEIPGARPDWLPTYYHRADSVGIGYDRSSTGSNAVEQYAEPIREMFDDASLCPPEYLLWFHHVNWDEEMGNGRTLWMELCHRYQAGVNQIRQFNEEWTEMESYIDASQFEAVKAKLAIQLKEAIWWKDACLLYFQTISKRPFPIGVDEPVHQLDELKKLRFDLKHHN